MSRETHVLCLGAGVQSTTLYLLACLPPEERYRLRPDAPWPSVAVFADTGDEPAEVYRHVAWLQTLAGPEILVRSRGKLSEELEKGRPGSGKFASIPCFTEEDHTTRGSRKVKEGRIKRHCTYDFKISVIERTVRRDVFGLLPRRRLPKDALVLQHFGISADEAGRAQRIRQRMRKTPQWQPVFPLLELGWSRKDCLGWLKDRVPHPVPRSACVYCPFHSNSEWLRIKQEQPEDWARACQVDEMLRRKGSRVNRGLDRKLYLHRSCLPLPLVDFEDLARRESLEPMTVEECTGACGL